MSVPSPEVRPMPGFAAAAAILAGLAGAWIAAGSVGLVSHPLRRAVVWTSLAVVVFSVWPKRPKDWRELLALAGSVAVAVVMVGTSIFPIHVLAVAIVLSAASVCRAGIDRKAMLIAAEGVALFALYRLAIDTIPAVWMITDQIGGVLGRIAGAITRRPLEVGATFAGLDFLFLTVYLTTRWILLRRTADDMHWVRAAAALGCIVLGHFVYLNFLSAVPTIQAALPEPPSITDAAALHWEPYPDSPGLEKLIDEWSKSPLPTFAVEPAARTYLQVTAHIQAWLPWRAPCLALVIHLAIVAAVLRFLVAAEPGAEAQRPARITERQQQQLITGLTVASLALAAMLPLASTLFRQPPEVAGKKIVFHEKGFLNWIKPEHGHYGKWSPGMYGLLPITLKSLGMKPVISADLSAEDIAGADAVVLIFSDELWKDGQLERLWDYVRRGGTLLVLGEHTVYSKDLVAEYDPEFAETVENEAKKRADLAASTPGGQVPDPDNDEEKAFREGLVRRVDELAAEGVNSAFNQAISLSKMRVTFDSSTFAVGGWLESYQAISHPASAGITDRTNAFGSVIGASVDVRWPAQPLVIGRWGWNDPGDLMKGSSLMGNGKYDPGERLGDLVLAAEQSFGEGRVVVFGDTSGFTNSIVIHSFPYVSRLFAYLAQPGGVAQTRSRQGLAIGLTLALAAVLVVFPRPERLAAAAIVLAISLSACTAATHAAWTIHPDGSLQAPSDWLPKDAMAVQESDAAMPGSQPMATSEDNAAKQPEKFNGLAYIDASHLNDYSQESWREDSTIALSLTLARNHFLPLMLPEFNREWLLKEEKGKIVCRARILVAIAPTKEYSERERELVKEYVRAGGIFIATVGHPEAAPIRPLLEEFGFHVGGRPLRWPSGEEGPRLEYYQAGSATEQFTHPLVEPTPLGFFKTPYFRTADFEAFVRFWSAWPIECDVAKQFVVTDYDERNKIPLIRICQFGQGFVMVVGDSSFALNRNLEDEEGRLIEGLRENAVFWRWLLTMFCQEQKEGTAWYPTKADAIPPGTVPADSSTSEPLK